MPACFAPLRQHLPRLAATTLLLSAGAAGADPGPAQRFVCADGSAFLAQFSEHAVTLRSALGELQLQQTLAADGARYVSGELELWFKGQQVTVSRAGQQQICSAQP